MPDPSDLPASAAHVAAALRALGAATVGESGVKPAWPGARLSAPALPVRCTPGDNLAIHVAITRASAGSALVVAVGDERELGYWGEVLTTAAEARGLAGLVIDGCVRDVAALAEHRLPVFASGIALRGTTKERAGTIGQVVSVGEVEVGEGDWVVGDADGVTVVPADTLADVLAAAQSRAERERGLFAALRDGATTVELLGLDPSRLEDRA
jgi:4-hydroxy-4-methyl-2-oxoglutarate aldolase